MSEVAGPRLCGTGINSQCSARIKGTRFMGVSASHPEKPGLDKRGRKVLLRSLAYLLLLSSDCHELFLLYDPPLPSHPTLKSADYELKSLKTLK